MQHRSITREFATPASFNWTDALKWYIKIIFMTWMG